MFNRYVWLLLTIFSFFPLLSKAQQIIDPCFVSVKELGFFSGSEDVKNICGDCSDDRMATDMMEWNGTSWDGMVADNVLELEPPPGCNKRAIWMGYEFWTGGGEAVCLRLDKPIEAGKTYSYTFTYASDGIGNYGNFSPKIYTNNDYKFSNSIYVGRMPEVNDWATNTFSFKAQEGQAGHNWLIVHAYESSGMILGQCDVQKLYPEEENLLGEDKLICIGDSVKLASPKNSNYEYVWNTGSEEPSIFVTEPGVYDVTIQYGNCSAFSSVSVATEDCEVRLEMPNVFTPNQDTYNPKFIPKEHNYLEGGVTRIYNRWGDLIFKGDLFTGWDGQLSTGKEAASGVYYYSVLYTDRDKNSHTVKGHLTVIR